MYKKPHVDESKLVNNPLVEANFIISAQKLTDINTFRPSDGVNLPNTFNVEREDFSKVYTKPEYRINISGLSLKTKSLFLWLIYEAEPGKDFIWINWKRYMIENNLKSVNTYKAAIEELCRYCMIAPTLYLNQDYYWINPRYFFQGNRMTKYPKHVVMYKDKRD